MKFEITHTCGHKETVQLYGPMAERDRRAEYLASIPCKECASAAKAEAAKAAGLIGSDKQIAWASDILAELKIGSVLAHIKLEPETKAALLAIAAKDKAVSDALIRNAFEAAKPTDAKWIIDNRDRLGAALAPAVLDNIHKALAK